MLLWTVSAENVTGYDIYLIYLSIDDMYSIHPSFPTFNIKMIAFCTLQSVTSTLSKALSLSFIRCFD